MLHGMDIRLPYGIKNVSTTVIYANYEYEKYIFLGYKQDDGTILLSGEKSNISTDSLDCIKKYIKGTNNA